MKTSKKKENQNFIVQFAKKEPTQKELLKKRAELFTKMSRITPDQLKEFDIDPAFRLDPFDAKSMWEKTIWAK